MGADRARISLDPSRQYRAIVKQQGRVTLEADDNEASSLAENALDADALDFVGPAGTPDDGYAIGPAGAPFDFAVGAGTMYVGGVRVARPGQITYGGQTEWADRTGDPEWIPPTQTSGKPNDFIYLFLREQEVVATEDSALREVALGGPDSAGRLRLIQRVVRLGTTGVDCAAALAEAKTHWAALGLTFDDASLRLLSGARLQASFQNVAGPLDVCEPDARGGYLGAENQLIRIKISAAGKLLWGFDNASFLYRVKAIDSKTLELQSAPVDDHHFPRVGQAVEVLRTAATFDHGDVVAAADGVIQALATPYNPDTRRVTLPTALSANHLDQTKTPVLFLRVWEQELPFVVGTPVELGATGLRVTISGAAPHFVGAFWAIAVRPTTPTEVYPRRYLDAPQPPEGPREWACPLAVIDWTGGAFNPLADCREKFDNLVELTKRRYGGCCTVTVGDGETSFGQFREIQDGVNAVETLGGGRVCVLPGTYRLRQAVGISGNDVIVSGCDGQSLVVGPEAQPAFVLKGARDSRIESLDVVGDTRDGVFLVLGGSAITFSRDRVRNRRKEKERGFRPAITVTALDTEGTNGLTISDCDLRGLPAVSLAGEAMVIERSRLKEGGVWIREGSMDVRVRGNDVSDGDGPAVLLGGRLADDQAARDLVGIADVEVHRNAFSHMSASGITTWDSRRVGSPIGDEYEWLGAIEAGDLSLITDLDIADNEIAACAWSDMAGLFDGQALGGIVLRQVAGLRIRANRIHDNGAEGSLPACGIFLQMCLGSEISGNTIVGNGPRDVAEQGQFFQGGVIAPMLFSGSMTIGGTPSVGLGPPAAFVHDNVVISPRGQALLVIGVGSISVADNTLTTLEAGDQPFELASRGRAIFIFDLGRAPYYAGGLFGYGTPTTTHYEVGGLSNGLNLNSSQRATLPDGRVLVHGNQISLVVVRELAPFTNGGALVLSLDDVSWQDNQSEIEALNGLLVGVLALGLTVRASGNGFTELPLRAWFSYASFALRNLATGNQATHCLLVAGPQHIETDNHVLIPNFCQFFSGNA
jgi:hypothetical protein